MTGYYTEINTVFGGDNELSTIDSADGLSGPPQPGRFAWAMPGVGFAELLERHTQARDELIAMHRFSIAPASEDVGEDIVLGLDKRSKFVMSYPFWRLLGAWWYFTRKRKANRPLWRTTHPAEPAP